MPTSAITRLEDAESWLRFKERYGIFERLCNPNPFLTWEYQHAAWRATAPESPCWLVELSENSTGEEGFLAAGIFLESRAPNNDGEVVNLESLTHNAIHMPPFLLRKEREKDAARAMINASTHIAKTTGATLIKLKRLDRLSKDLLEAEFERLGFGCRTRKLEDCHQLRLTNELGEFWESKEGGFSRGIRRSARLLPRETGKILSFSRMRGDISETKEFGYYYTHLKRLLKEVKASDGAAFYEGLMDDWSSRGWLDIATLELGGDPVAGQLSVVVKNVQWVLLTAYAPEYKVYNPGRILFLRQLEDAHSRGDRLIELGDRNERWKELWSNGVESNFEVVWSPGKLLMGRQ